MNRLIPRSWGENLVNIFLDFSKYISHFSSSTCVDRQFLVRRDPAPWLPLPPRPRRHRLRIGPQAFLRFSCVLLQPFDNSVPWRILPIPPAPALLDVFLIDVHAIGQDHVSKGACVLVLAVGLDGDFLPEGEVSDGVLGLLADGLSVHARDGTYHTLQHANENGGPIAGTAACDDSM